MLRFLGLLTAFLVSSSAAAADWETTDKALLGSALSTLAIDWGQTRTIAANPSKFHERNPFLGSHPSTGSVNKYFAGAMIGMAGLAFALPQTERRWLLGGVTFVETIVIVNNHRIGIQASF